jgi:hypothetical protein
MTKDTQARASRQEKVTLRATPVGARVIERLSLPNIDKSAELRRLIELGFACEQAGFILDGEVLRQAGRAWDMQPDFDRATRTVRTASAGSSNFAPALVSEEATTQPVRASSSELMKDSDLAHDSKSEAITGESPLLANLRSLSG